MQAILINLFKISAFTLNLAEQFLIPEWIQDSLLTFETWAINQESILL